MKLLILSDSHGNLDNMIQAVELTAPDVLFHLGDCWPDAAALHEHYPHLPLYQVPGNCDNFPREPAEQLVCLAGKRILLCHGHTYRVKQSLLAAAYAAQEARADLFLFGHTHQPFCERSGEALLVNPGSIGYYFRPSYALVTLEGDAPPQAELCSLPDPRK